MKKRRMLAGLLAAVMLATTLPQAFAAPRQTAYATRGQVVEMLLAAADDYNPGLKKEDITAICGKMNWSRGPRP